VQAHELGRDYEHCSALLRKLDDLDSDMKVDDRHVKSVCALADKLLQQVPWGGMSNGGYRICYCADLQSE
jgi:hypothetical protein